MENKKEIEPVVEKAPEEKDLISSDDVLAVVSGNQIALIEQLERAKQVALEQLEAGRDSGPINQRQLEAELKRREEDLAAAKRVQEEMRRKEDLAREEAERKRREAEEAARQKKLAAEAEIRRQAEEAHQRQLQLEEEQRKKREEQERLEQERIARVQEIARKKQEKEAAIQQAKLEKEQKRLAHLEEIKQIKLAKEEAKRQRKLAKEEARKQRQKGKETSLKSPTSSPIISGQNVVGASLSTERKQPSESIKNERSNDVKKEVSSKDSMPPKKVVEIQPIVEKKSKVEGVKNMEEEKLKKVTNTVADSSVANQQNKNNKSVETISNTAVNPVSPSSVPPNTMASTNSSTTVNTTVASPKPVNNVAATVPNLSTATTKSKAETLDTGISTANTSNGIDSSEKKEVAPDGKKSNFKYWMALILFICLLLLIIFLPQVSEMISRYKEEKQRAQEVIVTTGDLKCKLTKSDDKYDYEYKATFAFRDSKMYRLNYTSVTKGDRNEDALELTEMKKSCDILKEQTGTMEGIDVVCTLVNGVYTNEQILKYDVLDSTKVTTAYLEAGGTYPNYTYQQDISEIEKQMKASGYTCERER